MAREFSPNKAPEYAIHRENVVAVDTIANVAKGDGINCANYKYAHVQVIPKLASGANPTVAVYWWSEAAGKFAQENPALTKAGVGANAPYEFTVECRGRRMFIAVSVMASGSVDSILVSGFELQNAA